MILSSKNNRILIALLLILSFSQGCSDDRPQPVATHVRVKAVHAGCHWITLQILDPRYAEMGQKDFSLEDNEPISAVRVEYNQNLALWDNLKVDEEYYVDMRRTEPKLLIICAIAPGPPKVAITLLKIH